MADERPNDDLASQPAIGDELAFPGLEPGVAWGKSITKRRATELEAILQAWEQEKEHGERIGPFDRRGTDLRRSKLAGADMFWLSVRALAGTNDETKNVEQVEHLRHARENGAFRVELRLDSLHLEGAYVEGAHLENAYLVGAHLEGVLLARAHLEGVYLVGAHLENAYFEGAHLENAFLREAYSERANFGNAYLENANLCAASLNDASFHKARLEGVALIEAHLERASFAEAHLEGAMLNGARLECVRDLSESR